MDNKVNDKSVFQRVLIIGDLFPDSLADNIYITLRNMGHEVSVVPSNPVKSSNKAFLRISGTYLTRLFPFFEEQFSLRLVKKVIKFQPDLVISTMAEVCPKTIERMKKETDAAAVVCWYTDAITNLDRQYMLAAPYDILFVKEPYLVELLQKKLNKNAFYLPEACNPVWHKRVDLTESERRYYSCDIALVGNMYYYRAMILERLVDCNIKIWGPVFPRWLNSATRNLFQNRYVSREEKAKAFVGAKINLNTLSPEEIYGVNCRMFEIAGCGGFQIVDFKPSIEEFFEVDKEIVLFETLEELKGKIAYYISHEDERKEIALRSYERAHKEHTYEQRLKVLMKVTSQFIEKSKDYS